ncbi:MAG: undecaprenyl-diphosphate phosphatase [Candidatus Bathyarchaeia archaeon]
MPSIVETVILGIIQGLTEWLPVSSSGHLAVAKEFFGWRPPVIFYVLLHIGTLFVVLFFFRKDIVEVLRAFAHRDFKSEGGKLGVFVIVGSIPTAIIGYVFQDLFKSFFDNLFVVGAALLATGFWLFFSEQGKGNRILNCPDSLLIGIAQGIAIIPGISRSGATISTGLLRGVNRRIVFSFSFLLSIPAVLGATLAESGDLDLLISGGDMITVIVGMSASMVVGYFSLKLLQKLIIKKKFHLFAFYCWVAGALIVIFQIL